MALHAPDASPLPLPSPSPATTHRNICRLLTLMLTAHLLTTPPSGLEAVPQLKKPVQPRMHVLVPRPTLKRLVQQGMR